MSVQFPHMFQKRPWRRWQYKFLAIWEKRQSDYMVRSQNVGEPTPETWERDDCAAKLARLENVRGNARLNPWIQV